jgi:serine/threonine protein kinase
MASFWGSSLLERTADSVTGCVRPSRCPDLLAFLAITFELGGTPQLGLHQVLTNNSPLFSDVSMGGASFDVRKTTIGSFPTDIAPQILNGREFVVVKQPRVTDNDLGDRDILSEVATELQILRHKALLQHANIIDFLAIMYHNAGDAAVPHIVPALVLEYAELGSLQSYQADGYGRTVTDKLNICVDAAQGLKALHDAFIVHGDVKSSNLLVCRHPVRPFIVKVSDFGFALSLKDSEPRLVGNTKYLAAPEVDGGLDPSYLPQLDIYSYGLLVYTVFKNGAQFYEAVDTEDRDASVTALKSTGILAATTQINLLLSMRNEKCLLFLVCKVLAYSLQPDPRRRYRNFAPIINYLNMANLSFLFPTNDHDKDSLSTAQRLEIRHFWQSYERLSQWLPKLIEDYCSSFGNAMPCMEILKPQLHERARIEIEAFFGCHRPSPEATHYDFFAVDHFSILRDTQGLLAYDPAIVKTTPGFPV